MEKIRAGAKKTNYIKTSSYLPKTFDTPINRKWLDSTLDQMLSKGDLEDIDAFIGKRDGKYRNIDDVYLPEVAHAERRTNVHLSPAIVSYSDNQIENVITYDDIANTIKTNTDSYSHGAAYATQAYTFAPPITYDKFVNPSSYVWVPDMPVFISGLTTVDIARVESGAEYFWEDTDVSFYLQNNQRIRLSNYDDCTYMVAGVGKKIKLIKIMDALGEFVYDFETPGSPVAVTGLWDNADYNPQLPDLNAIDGISFGEAAWDMGSIVLESYDKDYIVIDRADEDNTAWSRNNNWIHIDAVKEWCGIIGIDFDEYIRKERKAIRPIIEFNANIVKIPQEKVRMNQAPLFRLKDATGKWLDEYPVNDFAGSKIFGYEEGTGFVDTELGFALSRRDNGASADIVFKNYLHVERYTSKVRDVLNSNIDRKEIQGLYFFEIDGDNRTNYVSMARPLTAYKKQQIEVINAEEPAIFYGVGSETWKTSQEFIITKKAEDVWTITELYSNGTYNEIKDPTPFLKLEPDTEYEFHNLYDSAAVVFYVDGETPLYANGFTADSFSYVTPSRYNTVNVALVHADPSIGVIGKTMKIYSDRDASIQKHEVKINGNVLRPREYVIQSDKITIPVELISEGDIIDLQYVDTNNTTETSETIPEIFEYNSNNKTVDTLTVSETLDHWADIIRQSPEIDGQIIGTNNSHRLPQLPQYGGTILIHDYNILPHSLTITTPDFNITNALMEQGKDWYAFKERVKNQARRLWSTKSYSSVKDLTNDVINQYVLTRRGTSTYKNSNMLFLNTTDPQEFILSIGQTNITLRETVNKDENIQDHLYVYLTSYVAGNLIEKLLIKNTDYTVVANQLVLNQSIVSSFGNNDSTISIHYIPMDESCYVPPSMTKSMLGPVYEPQVHNGVLYCHDGDTYPVNTDGDIEVILNDTRSPSFDPIAAVLYDIEKRIYAGLVDGEYVIPASLRGSQHRSKWYTHYDIENDLMYRHFVRWTNDTGYKLPVSIPDSDDTEGWTWNYRHINVDGHLGNLPGHWRAAYRTLFDTDTPHLTPWHMLGHAKKPTWWDDLYSWTEPTKRNALLDALKHGRTDTTGKTDLRYARYYWDWILQCPVDTNGELVGPVNVLVANPANRVFDVNFAQAHTFEDWSEGQMIWRNSALGQAAFISTLTTLSPAQAWAEFFVPGTVRSADYTTYPGIVTDELGLNQLTDSARAGDLTTVVSRISMKNDRVIPNSEVVTVDDAQVLLFNNTDGDNATTEFALLPETGIVSGVALTNRGTKYNQLPDVDFYSETEGNIGLNVRVETKTVEYVSRGLDQIIYNYITKIESTQSFSEQVKNVETRLSQKIGGFSAKNLLEFKTESSRQGSIALASFDYDLIMYQGKPTDLITASSFRIVKTDSGYSVFGFSPNKQQFYFYEADLSYTSNVEVVTIGDSGATVKKYKKFVKPASIAEYGTKFKRIQDVYNFIRGNLQFVKDAGYDLLRGIDDYAYDFARWAMSSAVDSQLTLPIGSEIMFQPGHGTILELNSLSRQTNGVLDTNGRTIPLEELLITRDETQTVVSYGGDLGSVTFAVTDFEHMVVFNNVTDFNSTIYDDVLQRRQPRLIMKGQRTKDWYGKRKAPGYLIFDDKIVQNWDTSVDNIRDYYDVNTNKFNASIEKAERLTNGNITQEWIEDLGISQITANEMYKGIIRDKGTTNSLTFADTLASYEVGDKNVKSREIWMFRENMFGDVRNFDATEFEIRRTEIKDKQQLLNFVDQPTGTGVDIVTNSILAPNRPRYVNGSKPDFELVPFVERDLQLRTAGDLLVDEADFVAKKVSDIPGLFSQMSGTDIETWNTYTSYKKGDLVRKDGKLYECIVQATGLNAQTDIAQIASAVRYPTMPYGSTAIFRDNTDSSYTTVTFGTNVSGTEPISILGSITNPVVLSQDGARLIINNSVISMEKKIQVPQDSEYPVTPAGAISPVIADTFTERYLTINDITVDLAEADAPVIGDELAYADGEKTVFALNTALGDYGSTPFEIVVNEVTVDGTPLVQNVDYTVNVGTNSVTFATAPGIPNNGYAQEGYVQEFYADEGYSDVVFKFKPINTKNYTEIKDRIENTVPNVFVFLDPDNRFKIRGTVPGSSQELVIGAGSANGALGLTAGTYTGGTTLVYVHTEIELPEIITRINDQVGQTVIASESAGRLLLSTNESQVTIGGTQSILDDIGIIAQTFNAVETNIDSFSPVGDIVSKMNAAFSDSGIEITAAEIDGYLAITSSTEYLEIGSDEFLNNMGISATDVNDNGDNITIVSSLSDVISNDFVISEWKDVSHEDPLLSSIWVTDDSEFEYSTLNSTTQVRYNSWNFYKFMNLNFYSDSPDSCSICAGNTTSDGNDAQITINTAHNLRAGDYVMIVNSTTIPSVDGIHKVTRVDALDPRAFYIDMYIDECGVSPSIFVMRSSRFREHDYVVDTSLYNYQLDDLVFVTPVGQDSIQTGTYVYGMETPDTGNTVTRLNSQPVRITETRSTNDDIMNVSLYNGKSARSSFELEVFDPLRGKIPGVADREIDIKSPIDLAVYTNSTDISFEGTPRSAWGEEQIGTVWWDTSAAIYFDYTQGSGEYNANMWGKQFYFSSIDIYEWVVSDVPPDEWEKAAEKNKEVIGKVASGEAYKVYDPALKEDVYYYTESTEWNHITAQYDNVYYFWVKNKQTIEDPKRHLTANQIASIIDNPTANGISWCAAVSDNQLILANVKAYVNNDNTVVQINRMLEGHAHTSWREIAEDVDTIPQFWYEGLRDNLSGYEIEDRPEETISTSETEWQPGQQYVIGNKVFYNRTEYICIKDVDVTDAWEIQTLKRCWIKRDPFVRRNRLPDINLHEFNKYGNDRELYQSWFVDVNEARREFVSVLNRLIKTINVVDEVSPGNIVKFERFGFLWKWIDYVSPARVPEQSHTLVVSRMAALDDVDTTRHTLVKVPEFNPIDGRDISELHQWTGTEWNLVEKKNSTMEFNDLLWDKSSKNAWDMSAWDEYSWDIDYSYDIHTLIELLRNDVFVGTYLPYFNQLWFAMINYVLSEQDFVDWAYKTTFIQLDVSEKILTDVRLYRRDTTNEILGYINSVKPFHTKIRNVKRKYTVDETVALDIFDSAMLDIQISHHPDDLTIEYIGTEIDGGSFTETLADEYVAATFTESESVVEDILDGEDFIQPYNYNWTGEEARRLELILSLQESLAIEVETENSGQIDKFVSVTDYSGNTHRYELLSENTVTIDQDLLHTDTSCEISTIADHPRYGLAYINGEIVYYSQLINSKMVNMVRGVLGTTPKSHTLGSELVFLEAGPTYKVSQTIAVTSP